MLGVPPLHAAVMRALVRPTGRGTYRTRVLTGPARGLHLTMKNRERLSFALGTYERHVVETLRSYLRPGDTAYDVGANVGYITLAMAKAVGPTGRVLALEPDPTSATMLRENAVDNHLGQVRVMEAAANDRAGVVTFQRWEDYSLTGHIAGVGESIDATAVEVRAVRLDDLLEAHPAPRVIKIDVEGAEAAVLRGAAALLDASRPVVVAEVRQSEWAEIDAYMREREYRSTVLQGGWDMVHDGLADVLFRQPHHAQIPG